MIESEPARFPQLTRPILTRFITMLLGAFVSAGCAPAKQSSFLRVQVCLQSAEELSTFKSVINELGQEAGLIFTDGGGRGARQLRAIGAAALVEPHVLLNLRGDDGMFVGVGNLGLPKYQVAMGFSEGADSLEARRFAEAVVAELKVRWRVEAVPEGRGALPMENCVARSEAAPDGTQPNMNYPTREAEP